MDKEDIQILLILLFVVAVIVASIISGNRNVEGANKYCFEKYQNLEEIKTCKEIFYR